MSNPPSHEAKGYLVLRADTFSEGRYVRGLNITALRKNRPTLEADEIAVRVTIRIPDSVFTQPPFETEIVVPERDVIRPDVTIDEVPA